MVKVPHLAIRLEGTLLPDQKFLPSDRSRKKNRIIEVRVSLIIIDSVKLEKKELKSSFFQNTRNHKEKQKYKYERPEIIKILLFFLLDFSKPIFVI